MLHESGWSKSDGRKWWMVWFSLPHAKLRIGCSRMEVAFLPPLRLRGTCFERRDGHFPRSLRHDPPTTRTSDFFGLPRPRFHPLFFSRVHAQDGSSGSSTSRTVGLPTVSWVRPDLLLHPPMDQAPNPPFGGGMDPDREEDPPRREKTPEGIRVSRRPFVVHRHRHRALFSSRFCAFTCTRCVEAPPHRLGTGTNDADTGPRGEDTTRDVDTETNEGTMD